MKYFQETMKYFYERKKYSQEKMKYVVSPQGRLTAEFLVEASDTLRS